MRIVFLLTQSLESPGGSGRFGPLAHELARMGHKVSLFALNPDPETKSQNQNIEAVDIKYVGPMHVIKHGDRKSYYPAHKLIPVVLKSTWGLCRAALNTTADIIYVCKAQPMNGFAGIVARYLRGRLLCVDCDDYEAASGNFSNRWQKLFVAFCEKHITLHAHLVTTNTEFMKNKLIRWGVPKNRIAYLPNGVDLARFQNPDMEKIKSLRSRFGIRDKLVVAYIGSLSLANHPIELLINAYSQLHKRLSNSILLLVGGGESIETLRQKVNALALGDYIHFTGRVHAEEIPLYYRLAHVTVDPVYDDEVGQSRAPLKLLESWAAGIPFVTADVGDRRLLLGDPPAGLLAHPGDPSSLADCLASILQNPDLGQELHKRGLKRVQEFTFSILGQRLATVFEQTLAASGNHQGKK